MKAIDSGALTLLNRILGLAGSGAQQTNLDDGLVNQVLDVGPIARRSLANPGTSGGLFTFTYLLTHAAANTQTATINPFTPTDALVWNGYPSPVPDGFDVWINQVSLAFSAGTAANLADATLAIEGSEQNLGIGVDQAGAALSGAILTREVVAWFDELNSATGIAFGTSENGTPAINVNRRIRRGKTLVARSTSTGAVTVFMHVNAQLVPSALGQDATT